MIKDDGIRALIPGVVMPDEEKEMYDAREYVRKKLGIPNKLPAAPTTLVSDYLPSRIIEKLPEKKNPPISPTLFQDTLPGKNIKNFAQKNNLKGKVIIDSKHPDGIRKAKVLWRTFIKKMVVGRLRLEKRDTLTYINFF